MFMDASALEDFVDFAGCGYLKHSSEGLLFVKAVKKPVSESLKALLVASGLSRDEINVAVGNPPEDLCADFEGNQRAQDALWQRNRGLHTRDDLRSLKDTISRRLGYAWDRKQLYEVSIFEEKLHYIKSRSIRTSEQFSQLKLSVKGFPPVSSKEIGKIAFSALTDAQGGVLFKNL